MPDTVRGPRVFATPPVAGRRDGVTVYRMPKLTDYARKGFKKRRRLWDGGELPEWWDLLVWGALALVGVMLAVGAITDHGSSRDAAGTRQPVHQVQTVNPYATPSASAGAAPSGPADPAPSGTPGDSGADFAATAPVQVPRTGGGTAVVPTGARAVASAAANAEATGVWSGVPLTGTARPDAPRRFPHGRVVGALTVEDPAVTGNGAYVFSATVTHGTAARSYLVKITVQRTPDGYAVLPH
jgi:hypothetical protein